MTEKLGNYTLSRNWLVTGIFNFPGSHFSVSQAVFNTKDGSHPTHSECKAILSRNLSNPETFSLLSISEVPHDWALPINTEAQV